MAAKYEWVKNIILVFIGIGLTYLIQPQPEVHDFLYWVLARLNIDPEWGPLMGITILLGAIIGLCIWFWRLSKKSETDEDKKTQNIIEDTVKAMIKALKDEGVLGVHTTPTKPSKENDREN